MKAVLIASLVLMAAPAAAQSPAPQPVALPAMPATTIPLGTRVGVALTTYDDGGRRDPFNSLVAPKRSTTAPLNDGRPKSGLAGVALADINVRGVVKNGNTMMAILEGPNKQSFVAKVKDRLMDASIQSIDTGGVVFVEQIDSGTPTQVRKALRSPGEDIR